ncbi:hypothetical protein KIPB_009296, partial [Kipferlia bialata]
NAEIVYTNGFGVMDKGERKTAVVLDGAMFNHSCDSSTMRHWDEEKQHMTFYAIRDIKADEEITTSYFSTRKTYSQRQESGLKLGFQCQCERCDPGQPGQERDELRATSDARMERFQRLRAKVPTILQHMSSDTTVLRRHHEDMIAVLRAEFDTKADQLKDTLDDGIWMACLFKDMAYAKQRAQECYDTLVIAQGAECSETRQHKRYITNPALHTELKRLKGE